MLLDGAITALPASMPGASAFRAECALEFFPIALSSEALVNTLAYREEFSSMRTEWNWRGNINLN
jgi:hypothetical protein